jgi:phage gpG-like protein
MGALRLSLDVAGEKIIDRTLAGIGDQAEDLRPAFEAIGDVFLAAERRQFTSEGAFGSGGWAPLSQPYATWKARHYPGKPILRRTDDLWRSLTTGPAVRVIKPQYLALGTDVEYAKYHQKGKPPLPRRRPVELPESTRREMVKILQRWVVTGRVSV